jgi:lipid II:glycine glycyltransferase (peptidoglycan interpeptide bridge formation enzyme)
MIKWAVDKGCSIYDFRGVSGDLSEDNPLYGLYRFKKGFNGEFVEFIGELDLAFNPFLNFAVEKGEKIFREARKRLFLLKNKKK